MRHIFFFCFVYVRLEFQMICVCAAYHTGTGNWWRCARSGCEGQFAAEPQDLPLRNTHLCPLCDYLIQAAPHGRGAACL